MEGDRFLQNDVNHKTRRHNPYKVNNTNLEYIVPIFSNLLDAIVLIARLLSDRHLKPQITEYQRTDNIKTYHPE